MARDIDYNVLFIIAAWVEAVAYGFLFCMFCVNMYFTFGGGRRNSDGHSKVLLGISGSMFIIATIHVCLSCYRLVVAYVFNRLNRFGGPAGFMGNLGHWSAVLYETLYATQEILGGAAAIYRCWVIWNKDFKIVALPIALLIIAMVFGYGTDVLFTRQGSLESNLSRLPMLLTWIRTFYAVAVVQNLLTTGLMVYAIYRNYRKTVGANLRTYGGVRLTWLMRTMVEAAALQLLIEVLLLILFLCRTNIQYIFLDLVVPVIGITFNAMTISYRLRLLTEKSGGDTALSSWKPASQPRSDRTQTTMTQIDDVDGIELDDGTYRRDKHRSLADL
ncbi:hypothetical protein D9758_008350 [Tetrapyrgos nigripes]|uniref:Uncharacterized protein n=1 Tax=Tetrapyrgos nigripes TaxID=182062 RepID=A0A8H5GE57_9AGAR|nr:hypothetical protein D9758_008350 [Tetrapyrgos nigripes]